MVSDDERVAVRFSTGQIRQRSHRMWEMQVKQVVAPAREFPGQCWTERRRSDAGERGTAGHGDAVHRRTLVSQRIVGNNHLGLNDTPKFVAQLIEMVFDASHVRVIELSELE